MAVGNLEFIKQVTFSGSSSSISITDIFSADYDVYKIVISDLVNDTTTYSYARLLDSSNNPITSASYDSAYLQMDPAVAFAENKTTNNTYIAGMGYFGSGTTNNQQSTIYVFNPFSSSSYTFTLIQGNGYFANARHNGIKGIGVLKDTQSCKGFQLVIQSGGFNYTAATINVYGLASK